VSKAAKLADAFARLDRLYAELPTIRCQGRCAIACGPIPLSEIEARRLQLASHTKPRTVIRLLADGGPETLTPRERCIYLTPADRCSVYAVRPLICRAWGLVRLMSCMHGCLPDRWLRDTDFVRLAQAIERIGGGRLLRTSPEGLIHIPGETFTGLAPAPGRSEADIDADSERTRGLRALHGGRIVAAVRTDDVS
jgi:Fe-S-cluster containining protein